VILLFKRSLAVLLAAIMSIVCLVCGTAFSAYVPPDVSPQYSYTQSCSSELTISGSTATCKSNAIGYYNETTKIVIKQALQKKNSSGNWINVKNATWTGTVYNFQGSITNSKSSLSNGTYRLRSVFTVYAGTSYETITKYSKEKTI